MLTVTNGQPLEIQPADIEAVWGRIFKAIKKDAFEKSADLEKRINSLGLEGSRIFIPIPTNEVLSLPHPDEGKYVVRISNSVENVDWASTLVVRSQLQKSEIKRFQNAFGASVDGTSDLIYQWRIDILNADRIPPSILAKEGGDNFAHLGISFDNPSNGFVDLMRSGQIAMILAGDIEWVLSSNESTDFIGASLSRPKQTSFRRYTIRFKLAGIEIVTGDFKTVLANCSLVEPEASTQALKSKSGF